MPTVQKDERLWLVKITMENVECPFLWYPDSRHGCSLRLYKADPRCTQENCLCYYGDESNTVELDHRNLKEESK
jgi:hypothetical protein